MYSKNKQTVYIAKTFEQITEMRKEMETLQRGAAIYLSAIMHGGSLCLQAHEAYTARTAEITVLSGEIARSLVGSVWTVHIEGWCPSDPICYGDAVMLVRRAHEMRSAYTVSRS
jgi:hypothetical protein